MAKLSRRDRMERYAWRKLYWRKRRYPPKRVNGRLTSKRKHRRARGKPPGWRVVMRSITRPLVRAVYPKPTVDQLVEVFPHTHS